MSGTENSQTQNYLKIAINEYNNDVVNVYHTI